MTTTLNYVLKKVIITILCVAVCVPLCGLVHVSTGACVDQKHRIPWNCWKWNSRPQGEQQELLAVEPSLQSQWSILKVHIVNLREY